MASLSLPLNQQAVVKLTAQDINGNAVAVPPGASLTVSDTTLVNATLETDGISVTLVPVALGSATVTGTDNTLVAILDVSIIDAVEPAATLEFDVADAVFSPLATA